MSRAAQVVLCVGVALAAAWILGGCGGGSPVESSRGAAPRSVGRVYLQPFDDSASQAPRWMDIADYLYAVAFRSGFQYPGGCVQLSYTTAQSPLQFGVSAPTHALKPNFCYQMKIQGPAVAWPANPQARDFTNWALGSNGRWWDDTTGGPLTDAQLSSHVGDVIRGYLYFDFLVTARDGSVNQTSAVRSSYHVTWKTTQRTPAASDGPSRSCSVVANRGGWGYDANHAATTVKLYGEWEPGRALPGQLALPKGTFSGVEFRLTEETFHSTLAYGGKWRTVMKVSVPDFVVQ